MKKSAKATKTVMSGGLLMNSSSSNGSNNESHSDDDRSRLPTTELIFSDDEKDNDEEQVVVIRRNVSRLKRQQATTSLQSPLSIRNTASLESIDNAQHNEDDDNDVIVSDPINEQNHHQTVNHVDHECNRTSFNESERTDSGIGRDSGSSWRLSSYSDSFHPPQQHQQHQQQQGQQGADQQQGIYMSFHEMHAFV